MTSTSEVRATMLDVARYIDRVAPEVDKSTLDEATKRQFAELFESFRLYYISVANRSDVTVFVDSEEIIEKAKGYRNQAREFSDKARKAGAPAYAAPPPTIANPPSTTQEVASVAKWIALGIVAFGVISIIRESRK